MNKVRIQLAIDYFADMSIIIELIAGIVKNPAVEVPESSISVDLGIPTDWLQRRKFDEWK